MLLRRSYGGTELDITFVRHDLNVWSPGMRWFGEHPFQLWVQWVMLGGGAVRGDAGEGVLRRSKGLSMASWCWDTRKAVSCRAGRPGGAGRRVGGGAPGRLMKAVILCLAMVFPLSCFLAAGCISQANLAIARFSAASYGLMPCCRG